jgi:Uma2 family endonuclease
LFISWESLDTRRVRIVGRPDEAVEVEGSPDLVLEVVSRSSVRKDTLTMPEACFAAGVREYWLVDARSGEIDFRIMRRGARGYRAVPDKGGWKRSSVLGRDFRLVSRPARHGLTRYELQVREVE